MLRLLFLCSQNRFRSPTAESVVAGLPDVEAASAGLNNDAVTPLSGDLVEWADIIFVMETTHRNKLQKRFRHLLRGKKVVVLGVPDIYEFMEPSLVELFRSTLRRYVPALAQATVAKSASSPEPSGDAK
jgi:predicted protein tyrosine phosphatase